MESDEKIRIVIAVGHKLFQEGLRLILSVESAIEIVGMANNGIQAIEMVTNLKPDLVILDVVLPELTGLEVLPIVKQKAPETRCLMLTDTKDERAIIKSIRAGAQGYLSKNTNTADIIKAIRVVCQGEFWIERKMVNRFLGSEMHADELEERQLNKLGSLTPREQDVLRALIKGASNKEIAYELFISEKTVKSHLNQIFRKLNVSRRLEAILSAIKLGLS